MNKTEKGIVAGLIGVAAFFGIKQLARAAPPEICKLGDTKCLGYDLYECNENGEWVLTEENSPGCGWTPGEAEFVISDLVITPGTVHLGETVDISVLVTNIGEKAGTKTVICEVI